MSNYNLKLTTAGQALAAKIEAGEGTIPLHITRVVTASGTSPDPLNLTSVVDLQQEGTITSQSSVDSRAKIDVMLFNYGNPVAGIPPLEEGYNLYQIGFYANDPDEGEILYRISQFENPNWVPALSERPWGLTLKFSFNVGNASEVIVEVNPFGFVTREEVENMLQGFSPKPHASPIPEYGPGDGANYGHVQLSDKTDFDSGAYEGVAATPRALKIVADMLNGRIDITDSKIQSLAGFTITGVVDTYAELQQVDASALATGILYLVRTDETRDDLTTVYEVIDGEWVFLSVFNINLSGYATIDMLNYAIQVAITSIDVSLLPVINANVGQRDDGAASAVNNTNSAISYLKGIFSNVLTLITRIPATITQAAIDGAARITAARGESIDRMTAGRATTIDRIGAGSNAASNAVTDAVSLFARTRQIMENVATLITRIPATITQAAIDGAARLTLVRAANLDTLSPGGNGVRVNVAVHRGVTNGAQTVAVAVSNMSRAIVLTASEGSAGLVAASGHLSTNSRQMLPGSAAWLLTNAGLDGTLTGNSANTSLVAQEFTAHLTSPTTLVCNGPVRWQIIEFR